MREDHKKKNSIVFLNAIIPCSGLKRLFTINVKHIGWNGDFPDCGNETIRNPIFSLIRMLHVRTVSNGES